MQTGYMVRPTGSVAEVTVTAALVLRRLSGSGEEI
jgi:hypothetical protein